jgi:T-complex protein 1 subunit theta
VLIKDPGKHMNYNKGEEKHQVEAVRAISESGAYVVVSGGNSSDMTMQFIEKYNLMASKIQSKWEQHCLCRAVNTNALVRLAAPTPNDMGF